MATIRNPILPGFNPDPSIVRVDSDYYVATSTFEWFPGVQIHHSKDLVHWELLCRPLERTSQLDMRGNPPSGGIWAPCLTHDGARFYLVYTDVKHLTGAFKDTHNYLVTAAEITGPWSDPVYLNSSGFDPSLFHDPNGTKWLVNMDWDWRPDRNSFAGILLQQYDPDLEQLVGPISTIFRGTSLGVTEGPHLYRREGYYYLLTAEGGTGHGHAVSMARSPDLSGPYEVDPENPILTSAVTEGALLEKAGHADIVETPEGEWYMVHLCSRPVARGFRGNETGWSILGRETAIQKVRWTRDGWLRLDHGTRAPAVDIPAPKGTAAGQGNNAAPAGTSGGVFRDDFDEVRPNVQWQSPRLPMSASHYSLAERPGHLRIRGGESPSSRFAVSLVARRLQAFRCRAVTCMEFFPESYKQLAGLIAVYNDLAYHYLYVTTDERGNRQAGIITRADSAETFPVAGDEPVLPREGQVYLRADLDYSDLSFSYSLDGEGWNAIGPVLDATILSDEFGTGWGFTGAFIGMTCQDLAGLKREADFAWFEYREL